jgi:hypothetical protein
VAVFDFLARRMELEYCGRLPWQGTGSAAVADPLPVFAAAATGVAHQDVGGAA